ncbi:MAG: hypothetical protein IKT38_01820 [Clostridia bacterium]|nr:hypothetical protein [Clostridia bacterium]
MEIKVINTKKECRAMIEYTTTEKSDFEERTLSIAAAITNIVAEFVHKEEDCETVKQAEALAKVVLDIASDMTKEYIDVYYSQIESIKEQNRVYEIAVEVFNDWLENSEFQGNMVFFENQYKNAKELEINFGFVPEQKAFFYLSTDRFIGHILREFSIETINNEETLERVSTEAFMIGLVIGDIIFEDESKNPIRKLSQTNPVDGGLTQMAKDSLKGETTK